jgi:hypothetical protein
MSSCMLVLRGIETATAVAAGASDRDTLETGVWRTRPYLSLHVGRTGATCPRREAGNGVSGRSRGLGIGTDMEGSGAKKRLRRG